MSDRRAQKINRLIDPLRIAPGSKIVLARDCDPRYKAGGLTKQDGEEQLRLGIEMLSEYQDRLAAQNTFGVLVILQGIDAAGKDGTIRHVMSGVNPQGVTVHSFKVPTDEELRHDFLWRYQCALPGRGQIGLFNRSHYEDVLVVRVHPDLLDRRQLRGGGRPDELWARRYKDINAWERHLTDNGYTLVKL